MTINGVPNYETPQRFVEEEFNLLNSNKNGDKRASENEESNKFDLLVDQKVSLVVDMIII